MLQLKHKSPFFYYLCISGKPVGPFELNCTCLFSFLAYGDQHGDRLFINKDIQLHIKVACMGKQLLPKKKKTCGVSVSGKYSASKYSFTLAYEDTQRSSLQLASVVGVIKPGVLVFFQIYKEICSIYNKIEVNLHTVSKKFSRLLL